MNPALTSFLVGGAVIGSARIVAGLFGPEYAALAGGMPTGLLAPLFLASALAKKKFMYGYLIDALAMAMVLAGIYYMMYHTRLSGNELSAGAMTVWAVTAFALVYFVQKKK